MYQIQREQQNQTEEHKQPSDGQVPKRSQTLFVKEVDTVPVIQIPSEIPSNIAPTPKVCCKHIYHGHYIDIIVFQIISPTQLNNLNYDLTLCDSRAGAAGGEAQTQMR